MGLQAERGLFPEALGLVERSWPQQTLPFLCLYLRLKISIHNQKATLDQIIADRERAQRGLCLKILGEPEGGVWAACLESAEGEEARSGKSGCCS